MMPDASFGQVIGKGGNTRSHFRGEWENRYHSLKYFLIFLNACKIEKNVEKFVELQSWTKNVWKNEIKGITLAVLPLSMLVS